MAEPHYNPTITRNGWAILVPREPDDNLAAGFDVVGPFYNLEALGVWAQLHITDTFHDNPHWVAVPLTLTAEDFRE